MSIKKTLNTKKQSELQFLKFHFKSHILDNSIIKDLSPLINNQIHTLYENLKSFNFTDENKTILDGKIENEEELINLIHTETKISDWKLSRQKLSTLEVEYFKKEFSIEFEKTEVWQYNFFIPYNEEQENSMINDIYVTVLPGYFHLKMGNDSGEISHPELLEKEELIEKLKLEFR